MTSSHKDAIKTLANIATSRAEYFGNDAPIITSKNIADEIGKCESTARTAADAVCSLPNSPIKRVTAYRDDGTYGQLTTYKLDVLDPVEILEKFVVIAENLEAKVPSRPQAPTCKDHPEAKVKTFSRQVCATYYPTLERVFSEYDVLCVKNARIGNHVPTVSVPVLIPVKNARIAGRPEAETEADARAAAMQAIPLGRDTVDSWKKFTPKPENLGPILISDHRATPDDVVAVQDEPDWLQQRPDDLPPPEVTCTRCSAPVAPGHKLYCAAHRDEADQVVMPWEHRRSWQELRNDRPACRHLSHRCPPERPCLPRVPLAGPARWRGRLSAPSRHCSSGRVQ